MSVLLSGFFLRWARQTTAILPSSQVWQAVYSFCFPSVGRRAHRGICFHKVISLQSWGKMCLLTDHNKSCKDLAILRMNDAHCLIGHFLPFNLTTCSAPYCALFFPSFLVTSFHFSRCCCHFEIKNTKSPLLVPWWGNSVSTQCSQCIAPAWLHFPKRMHASLSAHWIWHVKAAMFLLLFCT